MITPVSLKVFHALPVPRWKTPPAGGEVATLDSGVGIRVHQPPGGGSGSGVLWIHGGGYVLGTAAMDDPLCQRLAHVLDTTVAAVDYRLAPEYPYPTPLHDCYDALRWLTRHPSIDPARIAVAGASAGGGLAAALALLARDRNEIDVVAQVLVYPMLDDRTSNSRDTAAAQRRMWNTTSNRLGWRAYLGGADPMMAVPARHADLRGLPPTWIGVGTLDILHGEAVSFADRLHTAGVDCELTTVAGAFHGFDAVAPRTDVARAFIDSQCDFLRRTLAAS